MFDRMVTLNRRTYAWPQAPLVVVCVDGSEPAYMQKAVPAGKMPWLAQVLGYGILRPAKCVVPSFTNPNNISIVTGAPPSVHGISGNFFYDPAADSEIMMNDPALLQSATILAAFADLGAKVAVITAKDKLRRQLGHNLNGICFSSEKADESTMAENGIENVLDFVGMPLPSIYSADVSEFLFAAGVKIMQRDRPDIMYLSTTDYIQHKYAPGTPEANAFYAMMDGYWAQLSALGCTVALTADHGMNAKHDPATGEPKVVYLQDVLDDAMGPSATRVILPITDPYVVHHGALGSYATIYVQDGVEHYALMDLLRSRPGVMEAISKADACDRFELPADRVGDVVVIGEKDTALGTRAADHDLSGLNEPLRSHGGTTEENVPFIVNRAAHALPAQRELRNFDIFDVALNFADVPCGIRCGTGLAALGLA